MVRLALVFLFCFLCVGIDDAAYAKPGRGGTALAVASPILQDNTVNFGLLTRTGRGGVRLSSASFTTAAVQPVTFYGLDFNTGVGTPCATWTVTFNSGRSATDFTLIAANSAESSTAITPVPSSTGQGNLSGNYVFNVSCKDSGGNTSNTAHLTYTGVSNAVSLGNSAGDASFGLWPSGFGSVAGAKVLISTGYSRTTNYGFNGSSGGVTNFANQVTWQNADVTRPAQMVNFSLTGMSNVRMYKFVASGTLNGLGIGCVFCFTSAGGVGVNQTLEDVHGYFNPAMIYLTGATLNGLDMKGCTSGCAIKDSSMDYQLTGLNLGDNTSGTISNVTLSHVYINFAQAANTGPWDISDVKLIAPMINNGAYHTDYWQFANGSTPHNFKFRRIAALQADGVVPSQGVFFGGGGSEGLVYIDDGTPAHGPGKVVTRVGGTWEASAYNSHVYMGGGLMPISDNVILTCSGGTCSPSKTVGTLSLATNVNIGSPGSPVQLWAANNENVDLVGMIQTLSEPNGTLLNGTAGTSQFKNITAIQHSPTPFSETTFIGTISGSTLTVANPITNNIPGTTIPPIAENMTLRYVGCAAVPSGATYNSACGVLGATAPSWPTVAGTYSLTSSPGNIGPVTMTASFAFKPTAASANFRPGPCATADANLGTFTVDGIHYQGGISGPPCPAASMPITHSFFGGSSLTGADFVTGVIPETTLEAINGSVWTAKTDNQKLATVCNAILPAPGGLLDAGGGNWYGAVTGTGEWNDGSGTIIVGCGIH